MLIGEVLLPGFQSYYADIQARIALVRYFETDKISSDNLILFFASKRLSFLQNINRRKIFTFLNAMRFECVNKIFSTKFVINRCTSCDRIRIKYSQSESVTLNLPSVANQIHSCKAFAHLTTPSEDKRKQTLSARPKFSKCNNI